MIESDHCLATCVVHSGMSVVTPVFMTHWQYGTHSPTYLMCTIERQSVLWRRSPSDDDTWGGRKWDEYGSCRRAVGQRSGIETAIQRRRLVLNAVDFSAESKRQFVDHHGGTMPFIVVQRWIHHSVAHDNNEVQWHHWTEHNTMPTCWRYILCVNSEWVSMWKSE